MKGELVGEFVDYQRKQGRRSLRKLPFHLGPLLDYLKDSGLALEDMNYQRASEYQSHLVTLADPDGSVHYAVSSVHDMMNTTRNFYEWLKKKGQVLTNPFQSLDWVQRGEPLPRNLPGERRMRDLLEELRCFWKQRTRRDRRGFYKLHVMAEVLYSSGLRLNELANLRLEDVDLEEKTLFVREGKGGKSRKAFLNDYACQVLGIYISRMRESVNRQPDSPFVFGVRGGRALDRTLNSGLKAAGSRHGLDGFTSHAIRHTLGYHLLRRGCDLRYIQIILGHDDMASTSLYTKVEKQDLRRELDQHHPRQFQEQESE